MRMYPGGNYYDHGITDGLLRLHSTYRHDLKIYSSDEGRVQITAAAFAKGLLDLETDNNQLTPILASLVNKVGACNSVRIACKCLVVRLVQVYSFPSFISRLLASFVYLSHTHTL
jgi:hypothetical protein